MKRKRSSVTRAAGPAPAVHSEVAAARVVKPLTAGAAGAFIVELERVFERDAMDAFIRGAARKPVGIIMAGMDGLRAIASGSHVVVRAPTGE